MTLVTLRHVATVKGFNRRPGFCRSGVRRWFDAQGLDFNHFRMHGIDAQVLERTGDPMAIAVAAVARAEETSHGQ